VTYALAGHRFKARGQKMATNPNTTNFAVDKKVADEIRGIAKENELDILELTNHLLKSALKLPQLEIPARVIKLNGSKSRG
jgi:hypothetical protein